jgi:hypothetical protein
MTIKLARELTAGAHIILKLPTFPRMPHKKGAPIPKTDVPVVVESIGQESMILAGRECLAFTTEESVDQYGRHFVIPASLRIEEVE